MGDFRPSDGKTFNFFKNQTIQMIEQMKEHLIEEGMSEEEAQAEVDSIFAEKEVVMASKVVGSKKFDYLTRPEDFDEFENFESWEFKCPCCGEVRMKRSVVVLLQKVRTDIRESIAINSAYRCPRHNKEVGSRETSSHPKGEAVDVHTGTNEKRFKILHSLYENGCKRFGVYDGKFVHLDTDTSKKQNVCWIN